jgi:hypothetical protein
VRPTTQPATPTTEPQATPTFPPTATASALPPGQAVTIAGSVWVDDGATSRPLPGVTVQLVRYREFDCQRDPPGPVFRQATTDATGGYRFRVPPDEYVVAASGGPECLPLRWHVGPSDPGTANACGAFVIGLMAPGQETNGANVLFETSPGCP